MTVQTDVRRWKDEHKFILNGNRVRNNEGGWCMSQLSGIKTINMLFLTWWDKSVNYISMVGCWFFWLSWLETFPCVAVVFIPNRYFLPVLLCDVDHWQGETSKSQKCVPVTEKGWVSKEWSVSVDGKLNQSVVPIFMQPFFLTIEQ